MLNGYRFDCGPSLITMPWVFDELFAASGARLKDYIDLIPIDPICRYFWDNSASLDAYADQRRFAREMQAATGEAPAISMHFDATALGSTKWQQRYF